MVSTNLNSDSPYLEVSQSVKQEANRMEVRGSQRFGSTRLIEVISPRGEEYTALLRLDKSGELTSQSCTCAYGRNAYTPACSHVYAAWLNIASNDYKD